jgi:hypothetical protein
VLGLGRDEKERLVTNFRELIEILRFDSSREMTQTQGTNWKNVNNWHWVDKNCKMMETLFNGWPLGALLPVQSHLLW